MSSKKTLKPIALTLGATFAASLSATGVATAADNPFAQTELSTGYMVADKSGMEGKCGAGMADKMKDGKCGAGMKDKAKDAAKKMKEGKCGEGKCGGMN